MVWLDKDILEEYNSLIKEQKEIKDKLEKIKKKTELVSDVVQCGVKHYMSITGIDINRLNAIEKYKQKLEKANKNIELLKNKIEDYIQNIKKSEIRRIFRYRYIENKNWIQIMFLMQYNSPDTARKKHDRYLKTQ